MDSQLQILFDQKHRLTEKLLEELNADHRRELALMVKGTIAVPDRTVAMDALVRVEPESALKVLSEVIMASDTPLHIRTVAATQLGRVGGSEAEKKLIASLKTEKKLIFQIKVAGALGKMGSSDSIDVLEKMSRQQQNTSLRRQANLGLTLIGFRNHDREYLPPIPGEDKLLPPKMTADRVFKAETVKGDLLKKVIADIRFDSYGIALSASEGVRFECGRNRLVMVLNAEVTRRGILTGLKKPTILGLLTQQASVDGSWSTRYIFLAWPVNGDKIQLCSYRTDGFQVLTGSVATENDGGVIEMVAVRDGANTPARLKGKVRGKTISFEELHTESKVVGKRHLKESGIPDSALAIGVGKSF